MNQSKNNLKIWIPIAALLCFWLGNWMGHTYELTEGTTTHRLTAALNLNSLLIGLSLLAVLQAIGMFCDGSCKYRWVSALVLSISSAFWAWLAVITYHSAAWLTSIGVHKQALFAYIILCVICWLAADYIRQDITE